MRRHPSYVAVGFAEGPGAGLARLDVLDPAALDGYPQLPAVRGDLLERLGRADEAAAAFRCAAALTRNERERALHEERASSLQAPAPRVHHSGPATVASLGPAESRGPRGSRV